MFYKKYYIFPFIILFISAFFYLGCEHLEHRTISPSNTNYDEPDPDYKISLDPDYQEFTSFMFMGNRAEAFSTYFNKFFTAKEEYEEAVNEYISTSIATYNKRLDSLNIDPQVLPSTKDKFLKVIQKCSKIIQYNKNTKYFDRAVLLIGQSYYYSGEYFQAQRKFEEFLSRLSLSIYKDEALLFLGLSKFRLKEYQAGESILNDLLKSSTDNEIKAEVMKELSIFNISRKNYKEAISQMNSSIELTKDSEKKAERLFILAKIYTIFDKSKAPETFKRAYKETSIFDMEFYALLNEARAMLALQRYNEADELIEKLQKKYIEYPDFLQFAVLENANSLYYKRKFSEAQKQYYDIIIKYPSSKASAEAYYHLGNYFEENKKDFLSALVAYKKSYETNNTTDYAEESNTKSLILDRYFALQSVINDTVKITIPQDLPEVEKLRKEIEKKDEKENFNDPFGNPKKENIGSGSGYSIKDTLPEDDSLMNSIKKLIEEKKNQINQEDDGNISPDGSDIKLNINKDSVNSEKKDTLIQTVIVNEDSIKNAAETIKISAYFELAEMFYYNLNYPDSSIYYLEKIISENHVPEFSAKAAYYLATIYKSLNQLSDSEKYFKFVIEQYPNTIYANEARKNLGLKEIEQAYDSTDSLLNLASRNILEGDKEKSVSILYQALTLNPYSPLNSKALYTMGWLYENMYANKDSAFKYYSKLKTTYPETEYAKSISEKMSYWENLSSQKDTLKNLNDTLNIKNIVTKDSTGVIPKDSLNYIIPDQQIPRENLDSLRIIEELINPDVKNTP